MRPLSLTLKGPTRYAQPLTLDLADVPPGIVAVVGGNGEGKTTLIECMAPLPLFLELPSYPGKLADAFSREVRDGVVDVTLEWAGHEYRHVVQVDPLAGGGRGKAEAFLYCDGEPMDTPGRLADYRDQVAQLYPSRELFYAAAFSVQTGSGNWFDLDRVQRRDLFAQLLGLGAMQQLALRARDHRKACDSAAVELDREGEQLKEQAITRTGLLAQREQRQASVDRIAPQLVTAEQEQAAAVQSKADAQAQADTLREAYDQAQASKATLDQRRRDAQAKLDRLRERRRVIDGMTANADQIRKRADDLAQNTDQRHQVRTDLAAAEGAADGASSRADAAQDQLTRIEQERRRLRGLIAGAAELPDQLDQVKAQLEELNQAKQDAGELDGADDDLRQAMLEQDTARASAEAADRTVRDSRRELEQAQAQAAKLGDVPCGGRVLLLSDAITADCSGCEFLTDAQAAAGDLDRLDLVLTTARQAKQEADAELERVTAALSTFEDRAARLQAARSKGRELTWVPGRITDLERQIAAAGDNQEALDKLDDDLTKTRAAWDKLDAQREQAAGAVDTLRRSLGTLDDLGRQLAGADRDLVQLERAEAEGPQIDTQITDAEGQIEQVDTDLAALVVPSSDVSRKAQAQVVAAQAALDTAADKLRQAQEAARQARDDLAHVNGRLDELGDVQARQDALTARREALDLRRHGWVLLERALGRDGIQALEIDAAGPEVSDTLNELLAACFGRRFSCALRTVQEAGGGRKQREVFDLQITDGRRGGAARDATRYSVGERTLISEALKLALAIFNARRSSVPIRTLWRDECDGPLEPDLAQAYPAMLRRAMDLGGYDRVYLISHRPTVWQQADTLIRVADGQATVEG